MATAPVARASDSELLRRYHENGDVAARQELIGQVANMLRHTARIRVVVR